MTVVLTTVTQIMYYVQIGKPVVFHSDDISGCVRLIDEGYITKTSGGSNYGKEVTTRNKDLVIEDLSELIKQGIKFYV